MNIYLITNQKTKKQYVGITSRSIMVRFEEHKKNSNNIKKPSALYESMRKYGVENFSIELLETVDSREEAIKKETKYILEYGTLVPNGYNILLKENNLTGIRKNSIKASGRAVLRIDNDNNIIKYKTITEAAKANNIDRSCISKCVNEHISTAAGYYWILENPDLRHKNHSDAPLNNKKVMPVYQYSKKGLLIKKWEGGAPEAAKALNLSQSSINRVCRGERNTYKGYIWKRY